MGTWSSRLSAGRSDPNFDAEGRWDREFIDAVHRRYQEGIASGELTPTQMVAVLVRGGEPAALSGPHFDAERAVRQRNGVGAGGIMKPGNLSAYGWD